MWKPIIRAIACFLIIIGAELLVFDSLEWRTEQPLGWSSRASSPLTAKAFEPEERHPWMFLSGGIILFIYTFTLGGGAKK